MEVKDDDLLTVLDEATNIEIPVEIPGGKVLVVGRPLRRSGKFFRIENDASRRQVEPKIH